jgi:formylglycine-generating enzyme required for sulfatase activity
LFDMLGNVLEWCQDRSGTYQPGKVDPTIDDIPRLLRGGTFAGLPAFLRSAYRLGDAPADRNSFLGFRLARTYH